MVRSSGTQIASSQLRVTARDRVVVRSGRPLFRTLAVTRATAACRLVCAQPEIAALLRSHYIILHYITLHYITSQPEIAALLRSQLSPLARLYSHYVHLRLSSHGGGGGSGGSGPRGGAAAAAGEGGGAGAASKPPQPQPLLLAPPEASDMPCAA